MRLSRIFKVGNILAKKHAWRVAGRQQRKALRSNSRLIATITPFKQHATGSSESKMTFFQGFASLFQRGR
jgi:hypothetical protein